PTPAAPSAPNAQSFCSADNATIGSLTATGSSLQWYSAASGGSPIPSTTGLANGTYYVSQTVAGCESSRTQVTVTVTPTPAAPSAPNAQSFCSADNATIGSLTATGSSLQWYSAASGGSPIPSTTGLANGTYYVSQTVAGFESSRTQVTVTVTPTPAAPSAPNAQSFCSADNATIGSLTATGSSLQWYSAASGGSPIPSTTGLANGTYYVSQTVDRCQSNWIQ